MGVEQLIVLALVLAGFGAGWVARGAREEERAEAGAAPEVARAREALEALLAATAAGSLDDVLRAQAELDAADEALEAALGAGETVYDRFDAAANVASSAAQGRRAARR